MDPPSFWAHNGQLHELYVTLQTRVDSKSLGPATEDRLERKTAAGQYLYAQRQRMRADFLDVVRQAKEKLWKYICILLLQWCGPGTIDIS